LAPLALLLGNVTDGDPRFVVEDRANPLVRADARNGRVAQVDVELFVSLAEAVTVDQDRDSRARFAGGKGHRARRRLVIAAGGRGAVCRGVADGERRVERAGERDGEGESPRARVPFGDDRTPNIYTGIVVDDRPPRGAGVRVDVGTH